MNNRVPRKREKSQKAKSLKANHHPRRVKPKKKEYKYWMMQSKREINSIKKKMIAERKAKMIDSKATHNQIGATMKSYKS